MSFDKLNTVDANNAFYGRRTDYEKFYEIAERYLQNCVDNPGTAALYTVDPRAAGSNGQAFGNPYQYVFQQNDNLVLSSESIYEIPETRGVQTERPYAFGRPSSAGGSNNYPCKNYGQSRFHPTYYYGDFDPNDMRRDVTCTVTGTDGKKVVWKNCCHLYQVHKLMVVVSLIINGTKTVSLNHVGKNSVSLVSIIRLYVCQMLS